MCGIAGILTFDGAPADARHAAAMAQVLAHRGPDGEGIHVSGPLALAHRRLAIIDLSHDATQPMPNEDRSLWLVFNGEIYNYLEIIPELRARGHIFRSRTDSEVILHAYEEEGTECTRRFNGMWAFGLWDGRRRRLILSRDRLGEKPLYYTADSSGFLFASEIKALLVLRANSAGASIPELARFFATGVLESGTDTFFRGVHQVPPGHTLVVQADGRMQMSRFWAAPLPAEVDPITAHRAAEELRELLTDSIRLRLRSDVPVGTCLSGGIDSSSVVALESHLLGARPVHTFSSIFKEAEYSERRFVEAVNAAFPTVAHEITPSASFMEVLPRMVWHQEIPLHGPGVYPQWCVMALAKGKVKVLLDGQGADEILGGYFYYYPEHLADLLREAGSVRGVWTLLLALARISRRNPIPQTLRLLREGVRRALGHARPVGYQGGWQGDYLVPELSRFAGEPFTLPCAKGESFLAAALHEDLSLTSIPKLLHYEDRNSMAHGIEARVPFLDHRVVEFCLRLPPGVRIEAGLTKAPLRRALADLLPVSITKRLDKKGFPEPLGNWIAGEGYDAVEEVLLSQRARARGLFRVDRIERALREHRSGISRTVPLYRALTIETWLRLFQDREGFGRFEDDPRRGDTGVPNVETGGRRDDNRQGTSGRSGVSGPAARLREVRIHPPT